MLDPRPSSTGSDSNRGNDRTRNSNNEPSQSQPQPDQDLYETREKLKVHKKSILEQLQLKMQEELFMLELWEQELLERLQRRKNTTGLLQK